MFLRRWVLGFSWGGFVCLFGWWLSFSFLLVFCVLRVFFFRFFLLRVVFFRSFVSCLVLVPSVLARSPRLCPWFVLSGGRAFSVGSRLPFRVSRSLLVFRALPGWRLLVLGSLLGSVVAWGVRGGWLGRWLLLVLLPWVFRSGRVVFPRLASSFPFSRSVRVPRLGWGRGWGLCLLPWFLGGVLLFCCFFLTFAARAVPLALWFVGFRGF